MIHSSRTDSIFKKQKTSLLLRVLLLIVGLTVGLLTFILPVRYDVPIPREEAEEYVGYFEEFESRKKYKTIYFRDGSEFELYPYTDPDGIIESMINMENGTKLYLLINPNNQYVAEIRTETDELLNFETSQEATYEYKKGYVGIGVFMCIASFIVLLMQPTKRKNSAKKTRSKKRRK